MAHGSSLARLLGLLSDTLTDRRLSVAVAESSTGGLLGATLTDLPGASRFFVGGFLVPTHDAVHRLLGIPRAIVEEAGAVSDTTARLLAQATAERLDADLALAVAGEMARTAEPSGAVAGLVYVAACLQGTITVVEHRLSGGPAANRVAAVEAAIGAGVDILREHPNVEGRSPATM